MSFAENNFLFNPFFVKCIISFWYILICNNKWNKNGALDKNRIKQEVLHQIT